MTRTEAFSNYINKEFIKILILILIIEPKFTLLMINTKDVFQPPRQQAHCTRAIHIESDPAPDDRLHGGFGANLERFSCKPCRCV
ncbi:uncharacterized protein METZ01_LOCUS454929 [marine metagenome]|uniref:Uncharacterized protein n=1 Tax=marine metagenome TaxID=408172 RepID=A0A383A4E0_9ZZZZ